MATPPLLPRARRPIGPPFGPSFGRRARVRRWQDSRTWARLIREAEALWHVDVRDLRRLGALELSQLLQEVPPRLRSRVNRWLTRYGVITRLG